MKKDSALELAKEKGLDLIEIAPAANPPIARIMSFDKFRYEQEKKARKQRAQQKTSNLKQIQISVGEARHDLERKAKQIDEFLKEKCRVEILLVLRGREKANKDWARRKLDEFLKIITPEHKITLEPRYAGKGFITQIIGK